MKNNAIVCNTGAFDFEINVKALKERALEIKEARPSVQEFVLKNNKSIFVLTEGRIVNLCAAEGHPSSVMDLSYANQALSVEYIIKNRNSLEKKVYTLPKEIDQELSRIKLESMGINIDKPSKEMIEYMNSWKG